MSWDSPEPDEKNHECQHLTHADDARITAHSTKQIFITVFHHSWDKKI
jgi:hypothetical protein